MLVRVLRGRGHSCEEAEDGQQAVDVLRDAAPGRYDAVLMDFVMPRLGTRNAHQPHTSHKPTTALAPPWRRATARAPP